MQKNVLTSLLLAQAHREFILHWRMKKILRLVLIKRWNYDLKQCSKFKHQTMSITQSDYRGEDSCTEILIKVQLWSQIIFKQKLTLTLGVIL